MRMDLATLEKYHRRIYDACKEHYERLLGVEVDASGKDISRGFFTSYDEKAYLNEVLMKEVDETFTRIVPPGKQAGKKRSDKAAKGRVVSVEKTEAEPLERMEFNKAVLAVKRVSKFEKGNRDNFLFALGNIASTNSRQCLQGIGGNRRFLPSSVIALDYRKPVNYEGIYA